MLLVLVWVAELVGDSPNYAGPDDGITDDCASGTVEDEPRDKHT